MNSFTSSLPGTVAGLLALAITPVASHAHHAFTGVFEMDNLTELEGEVLRAGQQQTGSWFAHSKDKKLWLDRLEIRKDDGELITINLDQYSRVEPLDQPAS